MSLQNRLAPWVHHNAAADRPYGSRRENGRTVVLLWGGTKRSQTRDIERARTLARLLDKEKTYWQGQRPENLMSPTTSTRPRRSPRIWTLFWKKGMTNSYWWRCAPLSNRGVSPRSPKGLVYAARPCTSPSRKTAILGCPHGTASSGNWACGSV